MLKEHPLETFYSQTIDIVIPAYNVRRLIQRSVRSTLMQELPVSWHKNVFIVDDGSSDDTVQHCQAVFKEQVQVISHEQNHGRSTGRNTGWRYGFGRYVVFLDADCEWLTTGSLSAHLERLESGMDVSTGAIVARDQSFWATHENMLQSSREKDFSSGNHAAFTSANFAIRRSVLEATGGFDEGYRHYGFEDRDFLLRLISRGAKVTFCSEAAVMHVSDLSLSDKCRKMIEAGQYSSVRFQTAHPEYYARSSHARFDCRLHGSLLTALAILSGPLVPGLAAMGDKMIRVPGLPFSIKWAWVKMMSGLAYLVGTYRGTKG
jgi:GT2 family glycosyltransferase